MSIFTKVAEATEAYLDNIIEKAKTKPAGDSEYAERKALIELGYTDDQQYGYKEKTGMVSAGVLRNMARKDSLIIAVIENKLSQVHPFTKYQKDKYSPGWIIDPVEIADVTDEEKLQLADPNLDDESRAQLKFEQDQKREKLKKKQTKEVEQMKVFIENCGMPPEETDTTYKRWDFSKFVAAITGDRLTYFYSAIELVPTKDGDKLHHFYPVSSGTIKYVSQNSASEEYAKQLAPIIENKKRVNKRFDSSKPFRYVQVVRGKIVAAFTEDELIFEPFHPTVDPEDNGYAMGELEKLVGIVTAHLYAEAHNRNFFTQGIGTKGILHIKGDNISRAQLEAFKRQWFNQVVNTRNAFRPPIIGMAEDVKWVELAQSNKDMEFDNWMNYLIKVTCAIYQMDPSEINFDISKTNTSTLQEANNEEKLKASKDKGLRPLLDYLENLINNHVLAYWDKDLAKKYKFKFVGFDAESRKQEQERLQKETAVWKTLNEARIEMGRQPIENGDIVLSAIYSQYIAQKQQAAQMQDQAAGPGAPGEGDPNAQPPESINGDLDQLTKEITGSLDESDKKSEADSKQEDKDAAAKEKAKASEAKKSEAPTVVEYYIGKKDE